VLGSSCSSSAELTLPTDVSASSGARAPPAGARSRTSKPRRAAPLGAGASQLSRTAVGAVRNAGGAIGPGGVAPAASVCTRSAGPHADHPKALNARARTLSARAAAASRTSSSARPAASVAGSSSTTTSSRSESSVDGVQQCRS
jgi:hypothetical protein